MSPLSLRDSTYRGDTCDTVGILPQAVQLVTANATTEAKATGKA